MRERTRLGSLGRRLFGAFLLTAAAAIVVIESFSTTSHVTLFDSTMARILAISPLNSSSMTLSPVSFMKGSKNALRTVS